MDTHADVHVAAALDPIGGLPGVREFPATAGGYAGLLGWLGGVGPWPWSVSKAPAATAGPGPAHHRGRHPGRGSGPLPIARTAAGKASLTRCDAVSAARAPAQSGRASGAPKGPRRRGRGDPRADGRRAQRHGRTHPYERPGQALILTGPDDLRARFAKHTAATLVTAIASLRPRPGDIAGYATRIALRELGRRAEFPAASSGGWTSSSSRW